MAATVDETTLGFRVGPWRDGKYLVVLKNEGNFPKHCVKTDAPTTAEPERFQLEWTPNQMAWTLALGIIGHLIAKANGERVVVHLPVSAEWKAKRRKRAVVGWTITLLGFVCMFASFYGYMQIMDGGGNDAVARLLMWAMFCSPLLTVGGAIFLSAT